MPPARTRMDRRAAGELVRGGGSASSLRSACPRCAGGAGCLIRVYHDACGCRTRAEWLICDRCLGRDDVLLMRHLATLALTSIHTSTVKRIPLARPRFAATRRTLVSRAQTQRHGPLPASTGVTQAAHTSSRNCASLLWTGSTEKALRDARLNGAGTGRKRLLPPFPMLGHPGDTDSNTSPAHR
mgnify:CR=1 FL=1